MQAKQQATPMYRLVKTEGPDHNKTFTVEVYWQDQVWGQAGADRKKPPSKRRLKKPWTESPSQMPDHRTTLPTRARLVFDRRPYLTPRRGWMIRYSSPISYNRRS